jgi:ABC-2 type transport system permease protein
MPRYNGMIYEVLSAPISFVEIDRVRRRGSQQPSLGCVILVTARVFVLRRSASAVDDGLPVLTAVTFSLLLRLGVWRIVGRIARVLILIVTPLLSRWRLTPSASSHRHGRKSLFNPVVYLISGFAELLASDVSPALSLGMTLVHDAVPGCHRVDFPHLVSLKT